MLNFPSAVAVGVDVRITRVHLLRFAVFVEQEEGVQPHVDRQIAAVVHVSFVDATARVFFEEVIEIIFDERGVGARLIRHGRQQYAV